MSFEQKPTLYTLPHGIEVIGEYPPLGSNRYWRVRIRPHRFFADVVVRSGGCYVRRSRAVLAATLGRSLSPDEHVHHMNEDRSDDRPENLELISPREHNRHHKLNSQHTALAKSQISESLKGAYSDGRRRRPVITERNARGEIVKCH